MTTSTASLFKQSVADLIGTYHRIAGIGPAYEVIEIIDSDYASVLLYEQGSEAEEVRYRIEDIYLDPHPDETSCSPWPSIST